MATKTLPTGVDFVGNVLEVGDIVAYSGGGVKELNLGKVVGFTEKSARVIPLKRNGKTSFGSRYSYSNRENITRTFSQVSLLFKKDVYGDSPVEWLNQIFG